MPGLYAWPDGTPYAWDWALHNFMLSPDVRPCWDCGRLTCWIEINFETQLHPGRCDINKTTEWIAADRAAHLRELEEIQSRNLSEADLDPAPF